MSKLLDRLADARDRVNRMNRGSVWLTMLAAIVVAGGLVLLVVDERDAPMSLPEPAPPPGTFATLQR